MIFIVKDRKTCFEFKGSSKLTLPSLFFASDLVQLLVFVYIIYI
jgi:hypothetical protein